jgi:hypothetical protein
MSKDAMKDLKNIPMKQNGRVDLSISTQTTVLAPLLTPQGLPDLKV